MSSGSSDYLADTEGRLRFTETGRRALTPYFAMAGIDIRQINTVDDYRRARAAASPYFTLWLAQRTEQWPDRPEFNLLKTATLGRPEAVEKIVNQWDAQQGEDNGHV